MELNQSELKKIKYTKKDFSFYSNIKTEVCIVFLVCVTTYVTCMICVATYTMNSNEPLQKVRMLEKVDVTTHLNENTIKKRKCMKDYYEKFLLVIVYNYPLFDSVDILKRFYQPIFPNLFFCGPKSNVAHPDVTQLFIKRGIFGYHCLTTAFQKESQYEGYFYINDDVVLNYWNLLNSNFDPNFIWQSNFEFGRTNVRLTTPLKKHWYWWVSPYGRKNVLKATDEIIKSSRVDPIFKQLYDLYLKNGDGEEYGNYGRSDILYVPGKYMKNFQLIATIFYRNRVFLEIAIPTILRYLSPSANILSLKGYYIPGNIQLNDSRVIDSRFFWTFYLTRPELWFIHPFKLHYDFNRNRDLNLALVEEILMQRTKKYSSCIRE